MNLSQYISNGGKVLRGNKIIVIEDIKNGAGVVTAKINEKGVLQSDVISGDKIRIKLIAHRYAINYAPIQSLKLDI